MKYRQLGTSSLTVSEVCLGTMTFGEQNTETEAHLQLNYALEHGINFIDTAEIYSVPTRAETYGKSEEYIGNWLKNQQRDKIILASKIAGPNRHLPWIRGGDLSVTPENVEKAIDASLKRLQTDYLDLYQIHWPSRYVPMFGQTEYLLEEESKATPPIAVQVQLEALSRAVTAGKIRFIGLSNETPWGVCAFLNAAEKYNLPAPVSIQNAYSLINRSFEQGLTETVRHTGIGLMAYSVLAFGWLTGKYLSRPYPENSRLGLFESFGKRYDKTNTRAATQAYRDLAKKHNLSLLQLALNFVQSRWFVNSMIIGATSLAQLKEQLAIYNTPLSAELLAEINAIHERFPNPAP